MRVRSLLVGLASLLAVLLAGCASAPPGAVSANAGADDPDRQLMLMIDDRVAPHFRPGAGGGGYLDAGRRARVLGIAEEIAQDYGAAVIGDWPMPTLQVYCVILAPGPTGSRDELLSRLRADRRVGWVQPVQRYRTLGTEDDPYFSLQESSRALRLDAAHAIATGQRVRIAVIDSGADASHADLAGQLEKPVDLIGGGNAAEHHGTAVSGVIAARRGNRVGIVGVAPGARILPLRACREGADGSSGAVCTTFSLAKALQLAILDGAPIINMSLSGPPDRLIGELISRAAERGTIVVAAVDRRSPDGGFPASHASVVAVAGSAHGIAGHQVFVAPGDKILTTVPGDRWAYLSGDSFAAAHVSGVAAVLLEKAPRMRSRQFLDLLNGGAHSAGTVVVDLCVALSRINARIACSENAKTSTAIAAANLPPG
ncbi:MAG: S8 family serine peptidase [Betaproteobacteria bacterium]|nr:S8 family serine peptidase [Betaproteobacteria bacterium]